MIEYIKKFKDTQGYIIEDKSEKNSEADIKKKKTPVITTPFADDFNVISRNQNQHQKLLTDIETKAKTMGLIFKPGKCRSLSIVSGKVKNVSLNLDSKSNASAH